MAGPAAWNSLPDHLWDPTRSFDSFRSDFFSRYTSVQSSLELCDYALYKSTIDIDIDIEIALTTVVCRSRR